MSLTFASAQSGPSIPLHVVDSDSYEAWRDAQTQAARTYLIATGFKPTIGKSILIRTPPVHR